MHLWVANARHVVACCGLTSHTLRQPLDRLVRHALLKVSSKRLMDACLGSRVGVTSTARACGSQSRCDAHTKEAVQLLGWPRSGDAFGITGKLAPPSTRAQAHKFAKHARKVRLIAHSTGEGDLGKTRLGVQHK